MVRLHPILKHCAWALAPSEFDAYIKAEIAANAALVKAAGIKVN